MVENTVIKGEAKGGVELENLFTFHCLFLADRQFLRFVVLCMHAPVHWALGGTLSVHV